MIAFDADGRVPDLVVRASKRRLAACDAIADCGAPVHVSAAPGPVVGAGVLGEQPGDSVDVVSVEVVADSATSSAISTRAC